MTRFSILTVRIMPSLSRVQGRGTPAKPRRIPNYIQWENPLRKNHPTIIRRG